MIRRVLAGIGIVLVATACAVLEVLYLPLRSGSVLIPLSVLAAVVFNVIFTRSMYVATGSVLAALLPGAAWIAVIARSAIARPEGDLLITDGRSSTGLAVVNLAFMILGALSLAFAVSTLRRHVPRDRAKPGSDALVRHTDRRLQRRSEVSQPPETAGIT